MSVQVARRMVDLIEDHPNPGLCNQCHSLQWFGRADQGSTWAHIIGSPEPWDGSQLLQFLRQSGYFKHAARRRAEAR